MIKNYPQDFITQDEKLPGIYRGVVEDNNDPEERGRCRIRIFGVHTENKNKGSLDGIPTDELPWAEPALGLFEGSISGYGAGTVPLKGSHVFLFFENGHIMHPRFFASVPGSPTDINHGFGKSDGFSDPDGVYPDKLNEPDGHEKARGNKYPNNIVFATRKGIIIELDNSDETRIKITHPSDTSVEIDDIGNILINSSNNCNITTNGNCSINVNGNTELNSNGVVNITGSMINLNN